MKESQGLRVAVTLIALAIAALHGWIPDFTIDESAGAARTRAMTAVVQRGSDRGYEVRKILRDLEPKPAND